MSGGLPSVYRVSVPPAIIFAADAEKSPNCAGFYQRPVFRISLTNGSPRCLILDMNRLSHFILGGQVLILLLFGAAPGCRTESVKSTDFAAVRRDMVQHQIADRGISDQRVLDAFARVERHRFVDSSLWPEAYNDYPLPIGEGQTISQPYIVALMTDLIRPKKSDKVLEIGTGSGYQAAILAELVKEVYTIEIVESLGRKAEYLLKSLGYANVFVRIGDGYKGWPEKTPFDAIVITCAPAEIPQPLIDQLADGGRMVVPVGTYYQELILVEKTGGRIQKSKIAPVRFVPMTGETQKRK